VIEIAETLIQSSFQGFCGKTAKMLARRGFQGFSGLLPNNSIDIYSNLTFPRPILQIFLHFASGLTMLEDLPYLHKLARTNIYRSVKVGKSNHKTMQLFNRFVDLYGSSLQQPPLNGAVELRPISNPSS